MAGESNKPVIPGSFGVPFQEGMTPSNKRNPYNASSHNPALRESEFVRSRIKGPIPLEGGAPQALAGQSTTNLPMWNLHEYLSGADIFVGASTIDAGQNAIQMVFLDALKATYVCNFARLRTQATATTGGLRIALYTYNGGIATKVAASEFYSSFVNTGVRTIPLQAELKLSPDNLYMVASWNSWTGGPPSYNTITRASSLTVQIPSFTRTTTTGQYNGNLFPDVIDLAVMTQSNAPADFETPNFSYVSTDLRNVFTS
jgi:hypothetical protein